MILRGLQLVLVGEGREGQSGTKCHKNILYNMINYVLGEECFCVGCFEIGGGGRMG